MPAIDQNKYKKDVIKVLRKVKEPIWVSELGRKYGLPHAHASKENPAWLALKNLEKMGMIVFLKPRYYKKDSTKPRMKIALPEHNKNPRTTFEYDLLKRVRELESENEDLLHVISIHTREINKLKGGFIKRLLAKCGI